MCIFTHFAAGALAGGATGQPWVALPAGLASHALLDLFPHYDFDDWRQEVALGLVPLLLVLLSPLASTAAVVGGLAACLPDVENLLWKLGRLEKRRMIFPTHTGLLPHGATRGPRNLWVQTALAVACLAALGLFAPGRVQAAPVGDGALLGPQEARLLATQDGRTRFEVRIPVVNAPADWATVPAAAIRWQEPGPLVRGADGQRRAVPAQHVWLVAVPAVEAPRVVVAEATWWRQPDAPVDPLSLVTIEGPFVFRGVPLARVRIVAEAPGGGVLARLVLELEHAPSGPPAAALTAARGRAPGAEPTQIPFGGDGVLNPELFAELSAGRLLLDGAARTVEKAAAAHPFGQTTRWVRLEVQRTGVHRLSGNDLSLLGVPVAGVDPATLRLYRGGGLPQPKDPTAPGSWQAGWTGLTEIAIEVRDNDGVWDSGDDVLFYGVAGDAWRDRYDPAAGRLEHFEHPGTGNGVYWLTWEAPGTPSPLSGSARRIGAASPAHARGGDPVTTCRARLHREESYEDALGRVADNWAWDTRIRAQRDLTFDAGTVTPDSSARFVVDVRAFSGAKTADSVPSQASAWLNDDTANLARIRWTVWQEDDSLRVRIIGDSRRLHSGVNHLFLYNELGAGGGLDLLLDSFDILYWQPLAKSAASALAFTHWGDQVTEPDTDVDLRVALPSAAAVTLWDVGDPDAPQALAGDVAGGASPSLTVGLTRLPTENRHFVLFGDGDLITPPLQARRYPVDLRAMLTASETVDYVVIYDPLFMTAALELADLRADVLPGVTAPRARAVNEETIYDNFSGGRKDPLALRNFLKWLYLRGAEPGERSLKYVCLLGDASRDFRNYLNHDPETQLYDFLPTYERIYFPHRPQDPSYEAYPNATDDGLVSFDAPVGWQSLDLPDVAVGRLTARSADEATAMVRRVHDIVKTPVAGAWRNRVVMAADDFNHAGDDGETYHLVQADYLASSLLPPTLDVTKLYMVDYPVPVGSVAKPAARQEAKRLWNEGLTLFHYVGHGSENVLADEQLLLTEDIASFTNGLKRALFLAFSCDVGVYDSPLSQSMAETFIGQQAGGAVAAIAATQISFVSANNRLSAEFYRRLYPQQRVDAALTVGQALLLAKRADYDLANSQRYELLGDPAFRPPQPRAGLTLAAGSADTLRAGARQTVSAALDLSGLTPGPDVTYDLRVEESQRLRVTRVESTGETVVYMVAGAPAFRGTGAVTADPLRIAFKMPLQMRFGPLGRARLIVDGPEGVLAVSATLPVVTATSGVVDDVRGPAIALAFPNGRFRVPPGQLLGATIADTSGVNVLGTTASSSILSELDGNGFLTDVTNAFTFTPDSFTQGRVNLSLPNDLTSGPHRLALFASDLLGNVGSDTLAFQIVPAGLAGLAGVAVFPNPTSGACQLVCELSEPMRVEWEIFTVGGRRVWRYGEDFASAGPKVLGWDGRDTEGDAIANGVYLFVLRGRLPADPAHEVRETGRIVIMK